MWIQAKGDDPNIVCYAEGPPMSAVLDAGHSQVFDSMGKAVRAALTPELLKPEYRNHPRPYAGHCYVASEAYFHLMGGAQQGYKSMRIRHEQSPHWWIQGPAGEIIDLTAEQFETPVPYKLGVGSGFLTREPSKRAQKVINRVRETESA